MFEIFRLKREEIIAGRHEVLFIYILQNIGIIKSRKVRCVGM
jgi:hypothetical protein